MQRDVGYASSQASSTVWLEMRPPSSAITVATQHVGAVGVTARLRVRHTRVVLDAVLHLVGHVARVGVLELCLDLVMAAQHAGELG